MFDAKNMMCASDPRHGRYLTAAVIFVGEDLDVLLALSDRILVLADGKVNGILDARKTDKKEVGRLMTNVREER